MYMKSMYKPSKEFRISFGIASTIIITSAVLALTVNINFVFLSLLVAFGLMLTAVTGFCPMAFFIKKIIS